MFWERGKYRASTLELVSGCLTCPACDDPLEPLQTASKSGFVCFSCDTSINVEDTEGLPPAHLDAFETSAKTLKDIESLKDVVDELQARGAPKEAYALANLLTTLSPKSTIAVPARIVEACRLLDLAEAKLTDNPAQAARISSIRHELQGVRYGHSKFR